MPQDIDSTDGNRRGRFETIGDEIERFFDRRIKPRSLNEIAGEPLIGGIGREHVPAPWQKFAPTPLQQEGECLVYDCFWFSRRMVEGVGQKLRGLFVFSECEQAQANVGLDPKQNSAGRIRLDPRQQSLQQRQRCTRLPAVGEVSVLVDFGIQLRF